MPISSILDFGLRFVILNRKEDSAYEPGLTPSPVGMPSELQRLIDGYLDFVCIRCVSPYRFEGLAIFCDALVRWE